MFGLFKKEISWKDLEFIFIVNAIGVYKDLPPTMFVSEVNDKIQKILEAKKFKLTIAQKNTLQTACVTLQMSEELQKILKNAITREGSLVQSEVNKLIDSMPKFGIFFCDTPSLADIRKNIVGN
jgi:hypothetical protein